jgi:hypothetical protein
MALHVPYVSVRWPDEGQTRPKYVAFEINKTKHTIVVFGDNYKQFVYLVIVNIFIYTRICI